MTYSFKQNHKDEKNLKNVHLEAVETRKYDLDAPTIFKSAIIIDKTIPVRYVKILL